jgi:hypothetical protein
MPKKKKADKKAQKLKAEGTKNPEAEQQKGRKDPSSSSDTESESMDTSKGSVVMESPPKALKGKKKEKKGAAKNSSSDSDSDQAQGFAKLLLRMEKRLNEKERENRELREAQRLMPPPASPASPAAAIASPTPQGKGKAVAQSSSQKETRTNTEELERKSAGQLSVEDLQYLIDQRAARQKPVKRPSDSPPQSSPKLTKMQPNVLAPPPGETLEQSRIRGRLIAQGMYNLAGDAMKADKTFNPYEEAQRSRGTQRGTWRGASRGRGGSHSRTPSVESVRSATSVSSQRGRARGQMRGQTRGSAHPYPAKAAQGHQAQPDPKVKAQAKPEVKLPPVRSQPLVKNYEDYDSDDESSIANTSTENIPRNTYEEKRREARWHLIPFKRFETIFMKNMLPDPSDPYRLTSPQGPRYYPRTFPDKIAKRLSPMNSGEMIDSEIFKTVDRELTDRVSVAQYIKKSDAGLAEFVKLAHEYGFISFKVEKYGHFASFCAAGQVILLQKSYDSHYGVFEPGKLYIPSVLKEILEDSYIYKVGFEIVRSNAMLEEYSYQSIKLKAAYDLKWGYDQWYPEELLNLVNMKTKMDGVSYPSGHPFESTEMGPLTKPWANISEPIKRYLVQEARVVYNQALKLFLANAKQSGAPATTAYNLGESSRSFFHRFAVLTLTFQEAAEQRKADEVARIAKTDPYYVPRSERVYRGTIRGRTEQGLEREWLYFNIMKKNMTLLNEGIFENWTGRNHFHFHCPMCGIEVGEDLLSHECELEKGIYGDGAHCEYPLCENDLTHTLLTCPMILAWCQKCERRGHLPSHHSSWVPVKLESFFLAYEPFNLLTGFKLLAPAMGLINRITDNVLRFSYYGNTWGELPKSFYMSREFVPPGLGQALNFPPSAITQKFAYDPKKDPWSTEYIQEYAEIPGYAIRERRIIRIIRKGLKVERPIDAEFEKQILASQEHALLRRPLPGSESHLPVPPQMREQVEAIAAKSSPYKKARERRLSFEVSTESLLEAKAASKTPVNVRQKEVLHYDPNAPPSWPNLIALMNHAKKLEIRIAIRQNRQGLPATDAEIEEDKAKLLRRQAAISTMNAALNVQQSPSKTKEIASHMGVPMDEQGQIAPQRSMAEELTIIQNYAKKYKITEAEANFLLKDHPARENECLKIKRENNVLMSEAVKIMQDQIAFKKDAVAHLQDKHNISLEDALWIYDQQGRENMILTYCKHVHLAFKDGLEVLRENPSIDVQRASQDARMYGLTHKEAYYYQDSKNLVAINQAIESGKMSIKDAVKLLMLQERTGEMQRQALGDNEDIRTNVPRRSFYLSPIGKSKTPPKAEETRMDDIPDPDIIQERLDELSERLRRVGNVSTAEESEAETITERIGVDTEMEQEQENLLLHSASGAEQSSLGQDPWELQRPSTSIRGAESAFEEGHYMPVGTDPFSPGAKMHEDDLLDYDLEDDIFEGEQKKKESAFDKFDPTDLDTVFEMSGEEFEDLITDPRFQEYLSKSGNTLSKLKELRERKKKVEEEEEEDPLLLKTPSPSKKNP